MLNDFSWNMTGYIPKHDVNPSDDGIPPYVAAVYYTHLRGSLHKRSAIGGSILLIQDS